MVKYFANKICFLLLLLTGLTCQARQLHTVADGDWFSPQVWYNQLTPGSTYDTIEVANHLSFSGYLLLGQNAVLKIDSGASVCGIDTFEMYNNSMVYVYGYVACNCLTVNGAYCYFVVGGPQAVLDIGEGGFTLSSSFTDSLGCVILHHGNAVCNFTCQYDSNIFVHYNGPLATFEVDSNAVPGNYKYFFGDGDSSGYTTYYQVHAYTDTGYYNVMVLFVPCCQTDTLYTTVHITSLSTGLLPAAWCNVTEPFIKSAMPASDMLRLGHTFCRALQGVIKLYSLTGAVVYAEPFATLGNVLDATVPVTDLAAGCYVLSIETSEGNYRQKVMVER